MRNIKILKCLIILLVTNIQAMTPVRVMGLGDYPCYYWHAKVFRKAVNHRELSKGKTTIYPYSSLKEWKSDQEGNDYFREAADWVSGYFASAQRYKNLKPIKQNITTDIIVVKIFEICELNPKKTFEWATYQSMSEFLM